MSDTKFNGQVNYETMPGFKFDPYRLGNFFNFEEAERNRKLQLKYALEALAKQKGPAAPMHIERPRFFIPGVDEFNNSIAKLKNTPLFTTDPKASLAGQLTLAQQAHESEYKWMDNLNNTVKDINNKMSEIDAKNTQIDNAYANALNKHRDAQTQVASDIRNADLSVKNELRQNLVKGELAMIERNTADANAELERQYKKEAQVKQGEILDQLRKENRANFDRQWNRYMITDRGSAEAIAWRKKYGIDDSIAYNSEQIDAIYRAWQLDPANSINYAEGRRMFQDWVKTNPGPKYYNSLKPYWGRRIFSAKEGAKLSSETVKRGERENKYSISEKLWLNENSNSTRWVLQTSKETMKLLLKMLDY